MEENNEQSQSLMDEAYKNENVEKLKQVEKNAAKKIARKVRKAIGKAIKKLLKKLIALIPPQVWLIIAAVILGIILIAGIWYAIKGKSYKSISDIAHSTTIDSSGNIRTITSVDEDNRQLIIDSDSFLEQVDQWFANNHVSPTTLGLSQDDYSSLVTFLQSEAVSSFPDLRERNKIGTPVKKDELQGIVQFKRKYTDGTEQLLEFKKYSEFRKEVAKLGQKLDNEETQQQIYFSKDEVENAYNSLKTYFTLDNESNIVIVSLLTDENRITYSDYAIEEGNGNTSSYEYNISVIKANYQSVIQKYTMPFEFPLALLMVTNNPEFCKEVAKLSMPTYEGEDSTGNNFSPRIVIDIQDSVTSSYTRENYGYIANFKLDDYVTYDMVVRDNTGKILHTDSKIGVQPYPVEEEKTVEASNYRIAENWTSTTTSQLCVSEAITWIADYISTYNRTNETIDSNQTNSQENDEQDYTEVSDYHSYLADQQFDYNLPKEKVEASYTRKPEKVVEDKKIYEKKTNKNTSMATSTVKTQYNKTGSKVEEKWERFLSLLKIDSTLGVYNLDNINKNDTYIRYKLDESDEVSSPESNLLSAKAILLQFLSTNSKTVTLEEIMENLIDIYTGKIKASDASFDFSIFEPGDFITPGFGGTSGISGIQGQIYDFLLSKGMSSIGAAAILGNMERESSFITSNSNRTHFGLCQWGGGRWLELQNFASPNSWTDLNSQLDFLWFELDGKYSDVKDVVMNANDLETAVDYFCRHYEICGDYSVEVPKRLEYAQKWYNKWEESHTDYGELSDIETINNMITWAFSQLGKSSYYSRYRGGYVQSDGYCAAFVKNAYYEAGLGYIAGNAIDLPHQNAIQYDSVGKVNYSSIPVGACIVSRGSSSYGHVALYIGNGYVIEAGGSKIVKNKIDSSYGKGKFLGWGFATNQQI